MESSVATATRQGFVFLSHAGANTQAAHQFAEILRHNGLDVWFDKDDLQPGELWMTALESAIQRASAMIVYIGRLGVQAWVDREVRLGLVRNTENPSGFRLIPVLGEGAEVIALPRFLQQHQCVDLRDPQRAPSEIARLLQILQNIAAERSVRADYWLTHSPFRSLEVFKEEDSWLFFGRDSDTDRLIERLARAPILVLLGNSGSGKSSLIRAGLIPSLVRGRLSMSGNLVESWRIAVFRPTEAPFDELAESVPRQLVPELDAKDRRRLIEDWRKRLPAGGSALRDAISAIADSRPDTSHTLLVADQF